MMLPNAVLFVIKIMALRRVCVISITPTDNTQFAVRRRFDWLPSSHIRFLPSVAVQPVNPADALRAPLISSVSGQCRFRHVEKSQAAAPRRKRQRLRITQHEAEAPEKPRRI